MTTIYVVGRCLTCWALTVTQVSVEAHLPAAFSAVCAACARERQFCVTGQVFSSLSQAALRKLRSAQLRKVRPEWEQIPLMKAQMPQDAPAPAPGDVKRFHKPSRATHDGGAAKP